MDFRLNYDPEVLRPVSATAGAAAASAGKVVQTRVVSAGELAVLMMGMNQTTLDGGEVVRIKMEVLNETAGATELSVTRTTLASEEGTRLASQGSKESVQIGNSDADEGDSEAEDEDEDDESSSDEDESGVDAGQDAAQQSVESSTGATGVSEGTPVQGPDAGESGSDAVDSGKRLERIAKAMKEAGRMLAKMPASNAGTSADETTADESGAEDEASSTKPEVSQDEDDAPAEESLERPTAIGPNAYTVERDNEPHSAVGTKPPRPGEPHQGGKGKWALAAVLALLAGVLLLRRKLTV